MIRSRSGVSRAPELPFPSGARSSNEIILNRALADELEAKVGDELTLRLPKAEDIPADSPLGEKAERIRSFPRLKVIEIIATEGLGRFSLTPAQSSAFGRVCRARTTAGRPGTACENQHDLRRGHGRRPLRQATSAMRSPALCTRHWKTWACLAGMSN